MHRELTTPRLRLLAWTFESASASISDHARLSEVIEADVPSDWPPVDLRDAQGMLAAGLLEHPDQVGWWGWFTIAKPGAIELGVASGRLPTPTIPRARRPGPAAC